MSVLPKRKDKLPRTIFEKLNVFNENEDVKCKYYTKDEFKELDFDKNSKQMSIMHLNISSLPYHTDELTNLLNELNTDFKVIGITESRLTTKKDKINSIKLSNYNIEHTLTTSGCSSSIYLKTIKL